MFVFDISWSLYQLDDDFFFHIYFGNLEFDYGIYTNKNNTEHILSQNKRLKEFNFEKSILLNKFTLSCKFDDHKT